MMKWKARRKASAIGAPRRNPTLAPPDASRGVRPVSAQIGKTVVQQPLEQGRSRVVIGLEGDDAQARLPVAARNGGQLYQFAA